MQSNLARSHFAATAIGTTTKSASRIAHRAPVHRSLRRNPDGTYFLQVADERAPITVEDTPYVVTGVEDDGSGGLLIVTNDELREPLDLSTLEVGDANVLYCRVKQGSSARASCAPPTIISPSISD